MDFSVVLNHLQGQFPGQMVLYVDDIAKILGKSDKAVANLIARNGLPFKVKQVGGMRCVDIFQVSQWLSSDPEVAQQSVEDAVAPKSLRGRPAKPVVLSKPVLLPDSAPSTSGKPAALTGKMAAMILQMQHTQAISMGRFVQSLRDVDAAHFMDAVMEKLFFCTGLMESSFVVRIKRIAPKGASLIAQETRKFFESEAPACAFLVEKLVHARGSKQKFFVHLTLEQAARVLFHATACNQSLLVKTNSIGLELNGM